MVTLIQWSSFQKSVSQLMPTKFYEIDPKALIYYILAYKAAATVLSKKVL
jgi:hypothetical protein